MRSRFQLCKCYSSIWHILPQTQTSLLGEVFPSTLVKQPPSWWSSEHFCLKTSFLHASLQLECKLCGSRNSACCSPGLEWGLAHGVCSALVLRIDPEFRTKPKSPRAGLCRPGSPAPFSSHGCYMPHGPSRLLVTDFPGVLQSYFDLLSSCGTLLTQSTSVSQMHTDGGQKVPWRRWTWVLKVLPL